MSEFTLTVDHHGLDEVIVRVATPGTPPYVVQGPHAMLRDLLLHAFEHVDPMLAVGLGADAEEILARRLREPASH